MAGKPKGATTPYTVLRSPISHDGETYAPGERIELADADAAALLAVGAIEAEKPRKADKEPKS